MLIKYDIINLPNISCILILDLNFTYCIFYLVAYKRLKLKYYFVNKLLTTLQICFIKNEIV
jgi:hypothetical protein